MSIPPIQVDLGKGTHTGTQHKYVPAQACYLSHWHCTVVMWVLWYWSSYDTCVWPVSSSAEVTCDHGWVAVVPPWCPAWSQPLVMNTGYTSSYLNNLVTDTQLTRNVSSLTSNNRSNISTPSSHCTFSCCYKTTHKLNTVFNVQWTQNHFEMIDWWMQWIESSQ